MAYISAIRMLGARPRRSASSHRPDRLLCDTCVSYLGAGLGPFLQRGAGTKGYGTLNGNTGTVGAKLAVAEIFRTFGSLRACICAFASYLAFAASSFGRVTFRRRFHIHSGIYSEQTLYLRECIA